MWIGGRERALKVVWMGCRETEFELNFEGDKWQSHISIAFPEPLSTLRQECCPEAKYHKWQLIKGTSKRPNGYNLCHTDRVMRLRTLSRHVLKPPLPPHPTPPWLFFALHWRLPISLQKCPSAYQSTSTSCHNNMLRFFPHVLIFMTSKRSAFSKQVPLKGLWNYMVPSVQLICYKEEKRCVGFFPAREAIKVNDFC